jgi:bifunctional non-homologous end joining protein LigD
MLPKKVVAAMKKNGDQLKGYKEKRDFSISPEPAAELAKEKSSLAFVVQKHSARRTHYDLRLEYQGVLKSWAIPKGPSLDPAKKRLAVQVEDHPLEYSNFEGEIPPGQYGAGTVLVWDQGIWEPAGDAGEGLDSGHLKFRLKGLKLKGAWALVRLRRKVGEKKESWLLVKEQDDFARPEEEYNVLNSMPDSVLQAQDDPSLLPGAIPADLPATLSPQLATLVKRIPANGDDWLYEIKYDGYRILARIDGDQVNLFTRSGLDWTSKLKTLLPDLKKIGLGKGWLDGEVVMLGEKGLPEFNALQQALETSRIANLHYYIFDLPYYAGYDLRNVKLSERRALLERVLSKSTTEHIWFSENFAAAGREILKSACQLGLEGVMGKRKSSFYESGRTRSWIKIKCLQRQEFILVGYLESEARKEGIRALLLGVYDEAGNLRYAGRAGTGYDSQTAAMLKNKLDSLQVERSQFSDAPKNTKAKWAAPELVAEISFSEWTREGKIRHPVFKGLREDKPASSIIRETAQKIPASPKETDLPASRNKPAVSGSFSLRISNPRRVIDPSTGFTKLDLINYYQIASKWILPQLDNRPVAFLRAPSGIDGHLFFQKHGETLNIPGLKQLDLSCDPGHPALLEIDTPAALLGAVQMNVIEFHTWNATIKKIEKPDRMIFDLDPGEKTTWPMMLEAAELTRVLLEELDLKSFLKTSGGKGLHIVVPLTPRDDWDTVKDFSKVVAQHLTKTIPGLFSALSGPHNRLGKIYVDYNRNGRGAMTVAAYSARARAGLGVSMPCSWAELSSLRGGAQWDIAKAQARLQANDDPWAGFLATKQILRAANKNLLRQIDK